MSKFTSLPYVQVHSECWDMLSMLSDTSIKKVMRAILNFRRDEAIPTLNAKESVVFEKFQADFERSFEKNQRRCEANRNNIQMRYSKKQHSDETSSYQSYTNGSNHNQNQSQNHNQNQSQNHNQSQSQITTNRPTDGFVVIKNQNQNPKEKAVNYNDSPSPAALDACGFGEDWEVEDIEHPF